MKNKPLVLLIETSSTVCSVALARGNEILALREQNNGYTHAEVLGVYVDECLREAGKSTQDLDAVCVSKGPGSYTGLRIGVALAKGICYGAGKPLIAVNTLEAMADHESKKIDEGFLCPMIDARRMEVYTAVYSKKMDKVLDTTAMVIDADSFEDFKNSTFYFFGDGSDKCLEAFSAKGFQHIPGVMPSAVKLLGPCMQCYELGQFEDPAYFEPFYLKEFFVPVKKA
jgi:tRNA threonylcarbamoyladenosine biosynthesis protein TsaB